MYFAQAPSWHWAMQAGCIEYDRSYALITDSNDDSYVTGIFRDTATFGSYSLTSYAYSDIFVAKIDCDGNWLWATQASGSSEEWSVSIAIDIYGNSYITGYFSGTVNFGSYTLSKFGSYDLFIAKI